MRVAARPPTAPPIAAPSLGAFNFDPVTSAAGKSRAVQSGPDDDEEVVVTNRSQAPLIVGVLGGATLLVAVIVGVAIYITWSRGTSDESIAATNTSAESATPQTEQDEANPGEADSETGVKKTKPTAAKTAKKEAKATQPNEAAQLAALQGIRKWNNAALLKWIFIGLHERRPTEIKNEQPIHHNSRSGPGIVPILGPDAAKFNACFRSTGPAWCIPKLLVESLRRLRSADMAEPIRSGSQG